MTKFLCFSCLHAPITHSGFFEWLLGQIEEFKPDVIVNLGDWYEAKWAKRWPKWSDEDWSVLDEHRMVAWQARAINAAAPKAEKWWIYGNHDENGMRAIPGRIDGDIVAALHWRENRETAEALAGWHVTEDYGHSVYKRIGPITFQHGATSSNTGRRKAMAYFGVPYGLYVCAHTHRPRHPERDQLFPYWDANVGCGANWDRMHYVERMDKQAWGRACLVGECNSRRAAYRSKQWEAELRVHSLADERFE